MTEPKRLLFVCSQNRGATRVICLDIPDIYEYMDPELVALLEKRVTPYL